MYSYRKTVVMVVLLLVSVATKNAFAGESSRNRTIVTTDPELDDNNSLIRLLLYSNEMDIRGLVLTSSGPHWKGDGGKTRFKSPDGEYTRFGLDICPCTEWRWYDYHIQDVVAAYTKAYPNLQQHDKRYPTPEYLNAITAVGNVAFEGDMNADTPGSELIKTEILRDDERTLYLQAWGGINTIARALKSIEEEYSQSPDWPSTQQRIASKLVLIAFGQQDKTYRDYISVHWPAIPFWDLATRTWGYSTRTVLPTTSLPYVGAEWNANYVLNQGPLGGIYRVWGDGKFMVKNDIFDFFGYRDKTAEQLKEAGYIVWTPLQPPGAFISEGDSSVFLNLLDNGLRSYENPQWGGWGGRAELQENSVWTTLNVTDSAEHSSEFHVARWFDAAQLDFAARLQWQTSGNYAKRNHHPIIHSATTDQQVTADELITLAVDASDPDNDELHYEWFHYAEAGSYPKQIAIASPTTANVSLQIPKDIKPGQTMHIIVKVSDNGEPSLTKYQRVVLTASRPVQ